MQQQNSPWWQLIHNKALHAAPGQGSGYGNGATLAYQITGDASYAARAWTQIQPIITQAPRNANFLRQNFEQLAIDFDWLLPALTPAQRTAYVNGLNTWSSWALGIFAPHTGRFRVNDFDQTIGQYFGLALVDLGTKGYTPLAGTWLKQVRAGFGNLPIGGLSATGADRSTVRNALAQYMQLAAGGVSVESSQYNRNTLQLLTMGVEAIQLNAFGDFQLYSQGGWAVTHPVGYGNVAVNGVAGNDMLIAGLSSMNDRHGDAQQSGPDGSYAYVAGTTQGSYYVPRVPRRPRLSCKGGRAACSTFPGSMAGRIP